MLTLRSRALKHHAGQVSFPGGARERAGESVVDTALREAREEAGIDCDLVKPLGFLGRYDTISGYRMTPVVGRLATGAGLSPDRCEVDAVFTIPLSQVVDPACYSHRKVATTAEPSTSSRSSIPSTISGAQPPRCCTISACGWERLNR